MLGMLLAAAVFAAPPARDAIPGVPNALRVAPALWCGGQPEGAAAFQALAAKGIKTVVSVDGAAPDAAAAQRHGLRYVHLPIGYDGVPAARAKELAKLLREAAGPVFVHCHHGKHRAPAALATAAVAAGLIGPAAAAATVKLGGTGAEYPGLHRSVANAQPISAGELAALKVEYRESVPPPPTGAAMLKLEARLAELLKRPRTEEATLLREDLAELARLPETLRRGPEYLRLLDANRTAAEKLEDALRAGQPAAAALAACKQCCTACHRAFRDAPAR